MAASLSARKPKTLENIEARELMTLTFPPTKLPLNSGRLLERDNDGVPVTADANMVTFVTP